MNRLKRYLYTEVGIEFKACLYFGLLLFFYFIYQIIGGSLYAGIIQMMEMVFTAYIIGYIQVYLLGNFDEAEHFGVREGIASVGCSVLYTIVSFWLKWFERNVKVSVYFFLYLLLCYVCVALIYRLKREADTIMLNSELNNFKEKKEEKIRQ